MHAYMQRLKNTKHHSQQGHMPSKRSSGLAARRLTRASGWNGSMAVSPAAVGAVHTAALSCRHEAKRHEH